MLTHCRDDAKGRLHGFEFPRAEMTRVLQRHNALRADAHVVEESFSLLSFLLNDLCSKPHRVECAMQTDPPPEPSLGMKLPACLPARVWCPISCTALDVASSRRSCKD